MATWLELQLGNGEAEGVRLFSEASSWNMWTVHTARAVSAASRSSAPSTHFQGYGLGWNLNDYLGRLIVSHGGGKQGRALQVAEVVTHQRFHLGRIDRPRHDEDGVVRGVVALEEPARLGHGRGRDVLVAADRRVRVRLALPACR